MRGVPQARLSTPRRWDEIDDVLAGDLTIATVPARPADLGDLHSGIDDGPYSLQALLQWAERGERGGALESR
jgi:DNA primase